MSSGRGVGSGAALQGRPLRGQAASEVTKALVARGAVPSPSWLHRLPPGLRLPLGRLLSRGLAPSTAVGACCVSGALRARVRSFPPTARGWGVGVGVGLSSPRWMVSAVKDVMAG